MFTPVRLSVARQLSALVLLTAATSSFADTSNTPAAAPPPQAYTDRPAVTVRTDIFSGPSAFYPQSNYNDPFGRDYLYRNVGIHQSTYIVVRPRIYFPVFPPALGQDLPEAARPTMQSNVPANLMTYVSEPFFAPLSAYLYTESLSERRRARISEYRADRSVLLSELRARLDALKGEDRERRRSALAELARSQDPRLSELETRADGIRDELARGSFFAGRVDWKGFRDWRLGDDTRYESHVDEMKVLRGSAYFQRGLSAGQRALLQELAFEVQELSEIVADPTAEIALDGSPRPLFFSPATARIRMPEELPPGLAGKIATYRAKKDALKRELRETIYRLDRAWFEFKVVAALSELAARQAPRIEELDTLAEEIRVGLSGTAYPDEPRQVLAPEIVSRVTAYFAAKGELQRLLVAKLNEVKSALPTDRVEFTRQGDAFGVTIVPNRQTSKAVARKRESIQASLTAFNEANARRYVALASDREALWAHVRKASVAFTQNGSTGRSVDQLLRDFEQALRQQERWNRYQDYRTAVLEPGLSPAQRRLLYAGAVEVLLADSTPTFL